jgi:hypothetical protein
LTKKFPSCIPSTPGRITLLVVPADVPGEGFIPRPGAEVETHSDRLLAEAGFRAIAS